MAGKNSGLGTGIIIVIVGVCGVFFCCISSVIVAIAVPNFLEFQTRAKVSRVKSDMRSMATAIEAYNVDHKAYPAWSAGDESATGNPLSPSFALSENGNRFETLTTPIAWVTHYFSDPFEEQKDTTYSYYSTKFGWVTWSKGPDRDSDVDVNSIMSIYNRNLYNRNGMINPLSQEYQNLVQVSYDPTNGTTSSGDIFRLKQ